MRLKKGVLKKCSKGPLSLILYLNLSNLDLDIIERLSKCEYLHWFIARNNNFQSDEGIEHLKQLWHLDLSNNKIQSLIGLNRFLALGTLILSNNKLKWQDLQRLRHAHIMSLSLHGNPQLDSDPFYRIHVIDSLPLVWELDGRLVTVTERLHVKQFFVDTQLTEHPVRHKVSKPFQTSTLKNIGTEGIVSDKCKYIFSKFPVSETHTKHTDERRLLYLTQMVQEDINRFLFEQDIKTKLSDNFLDLLIQERTKNIERCNMVLLLLVISLEFHLPTSLVRSTLIYAQLDMIGAVSIMPYFLLPREFRTRVIGILINAAKVDRDNKVKNEGGLYAQLFMCIYYTVAQLTKISQTSHSNMQKIKPIPHDSDYMALMASEVVSLMLNSPLFFEHIMGEHGVVALVTAATGNLDIVLSAREKLLEFDGCLDEDEKTIQELYEEIHKMVIGAIEKRLSRINIKMNDIPVGDRYLSLSDSLPIKPLHSVIWASTFLSQGQTIPRTDPPILNPVREAAKPKPLQPRMGEKVLLGPQVVGELTMLMEGEIAMVKIDAVPVANGAVVSKLKSTDGHFAFVDTKNMCYAQDIRMWRPLKTEGDKYTIHSTETEAPVEFHDVDISERIRSRTRSAPLMYTSRLKDKDSKMAHQVRRRQDSRRTSFQLDIVSSSKQDTGAYQNVNFSFSNREFEELFPEAEPKNHRPISSSTQSAKAKDTETKTKKLACPIINCGPLHENDNVHYIRGFTPREDSSRSCSMNATLSDRKQMSELSTSSRSILRTADIEKNPSSPNDSKELHINQKNGNETPLQLSPHRLPTTQSENLDSSQGSGRGTHTHQEETSREIYVDDNCPICIANRQGSVFKAADGQIEPIQLEVPSLTQGHPMPSSKPMDTVRVESSRLDLHIVEKNDENVKNHDKENHENQGINDDHQKSLDKDNDENQEPLVTKEIPEVNIRPRSSLPSGSVRLRSGDMHQINRPKSAMETYSYYVITNPPNVVAKGTKARINDRYTSKEPSLFKTDFQLEREDVWKRTTRARRPQTAAVMTASHMPPPQRPTSPTLKGDYVPKNPKLRITRTDRWLGGGRDLYWESVRKRPKSGHVPGWKEGLPEGMRKKQRPVTAHSLPMTWMNISRPGSTTLVSSCSNCSPPPYGYPISGGQVPVMRGEENEIVYMSQAPAVLHPMEERTRVVTSPVSDEDEQIFVEDVMPKERDLFIQGVPPFTIPHPRKFTYLPYTTDIYSQDEFMDYTYKKGDDYSMYLSSTNEDLKYATSSRMSGEYCPPPSPRDKGSFPEPDIIDQGEGFKFSHDDNPAISSRYKLCPSHEKMVMEGRGNIIIYFTDSNILQE